MRLILTKASHFKMKQNLLWFGTTTFVTVLFWIIYSVYIAFSHTEVDPQVQQLLTPLNPTLNEETLAIFEDRYQPPDEYTILVKQGDGDSSQVVPLGTQPIDGLASPSAQVDTGTNPTSSPEE